MARRSFVAIVIASVALASSACGSSPGGPDRIVRLDFDFNAGPHGWTAGVADYPVSYGPREPTADYRSLPAELDASRRGLYIVTGGENVFSYYKGRAAGLRPQTRYRVAFEVEFATNTSRNCVGAGGPPGEGTFVKAGASDIEPERVVMGSYCGMNVDKGDEGYGGADALLVGDIANTFECRFDNGRLVSRWELKRLSSGPSVLHVQPTSDGSIWFLLGTDQMFSGGLELYYTRFIATFTPE